jgi:hypothetical protein
MGHRVRRAVDFRLVITRRQPVQEAPVVVPENLGSARSRGRVRAPCRVELRSLRIGRDRTKRIRFAAQLSIYSVEQTRAPLRRSREAVATQSCTVMGRIPIQRASPGWRCFRDRVWAARCEAL